MVLFHLDIMHIQVFTSVCLSSLAAIIDMIRLFCRIMLQGTQKQGYLALAVHF